MAGIILLILKILSIILLIVVAIILVLVGVILLNPIKYRYKFVYNDEFKENNCHYVDLSWIFRIIKCRISISLSNVDYELKIFGFRSKILDKYLNNQDDFFDDFDIDETNLNEDSEMDLKNKKSSNNKKGFKKNVDYEKEDFKSEDDSKNRKEDNLLCKKDDKSVIESEDEKNSINDRESDENKSYLQEISDIWEEMTSEDDSYEEYRNIHSKTKRKVRFRKPNLRVLNPIRWFKILLGKLVSFIKFIVKIVKQIIGSIDRIVESVMLIGDFLDRRSTDIGIDKLKEYISIVFKHVKPRKKKIELAVGFDDPSTTGKVLGVCGVVRTFIGEGMNVYPNFSDKEFKIKCFVKGHLRIANLLVLIIKFKRDKAIRRLIYNFNKLKEDLQYGR